MLVCRYLLHYVYANCIRVSENNTGKSISDVPREYREILSHSEGGNVQTVHLIMIMSS